MKLLDVVALLENLPEIGLFRGQVGTIVEETVAITRHQQLLKLNEESQ